MPPELYELLQRLEADGKLFYTMTAINQPTGLDDAGQPVWPAVASYSLQVHPAGSKMFTDHQNARTSVSALDPDFEDDSEDCNTCEGDGFLHGHLHDEECPDCDGTGRK